MSEEISAEWHVRRGADDDKRPLPQRALDVADLHEGGAGGGQPAPRTFNDVSHHVGSWFDSRRDVDCDILRSHTKYE